MAMVDKNSYVLSLVRTAIAGISGLHTYKTEVALRSGKQLPGVYATPMTNTADPGRYEGEDGDFEDKEEKALIALFLEIEVPERDTEGEGLLFAEYCRVLQLIEHTVESSIEGQRDENEFYIVQTQRACVIGNSPLFDDESRRGSAEIMVEVPFSSVRK